MINWILSFKTFTMETTQVSTLRKKLDSLSSANQIRENNESANQSKASEHVVTQQSHRALESIFRTERQSVLFFFRYCQIFL